MSFSRRICRAIAAGASMNVIEIDAASNNGVDNIREIVDEVSYSPAEGKYKVYIIDEVHMLSIGAFNALLKTLEEPPSYVIFILATTEVHKLPITILSRCQRYDFKRISIDTITSRMQTLIDAESVSVEDRALRYIAKVADGSMRDALSLLDQCIAFHFGKEYARTTQRTTLNEGVNEGVNKGVNKGDTHIDAINQIENVSDTTKIELAKILRLFRDNEGLKLKDIALRIDRPAKTIERYLRILKDLSIIEFRGAPRSGKYYVVEL